MIRFLAAACFLVSALLPAVPLHGQQEGTDYPRAPREFRGVWVTSLKNLDWPSRPGLSSREQQEELIAILDRARSLHLNAVILQVRSMGDAMYPSEHAPWSHFLTGEMGRAPNPGYDPLAFAVREAHRRGLEIHAWINPYRVHHDVGTVEVSRNHISRTRPELVRRYGNLLWLDPSEPAVREHVLNVVRELVRKYDIDGIHIDDYFYPWPIAGTDFPDSANWDRYRRAGGDLSRGDWRRNNVNELIRRLYETVKQEDPKVKVGISPFGIWRPENPPGITGSDQYAMLYADPKLWLNRGWLDYLAPQLYWSITQERQSFPRLLEWWHSQNTRNRHIWPGLATWRVTDANWPTREIINQISLTRQQSGSAGHIHFRQRWLQEDLGNIATALRTSAYRGPVLVPPTPWLGSEAPPRPRVRFEVTGDNAEGRLHINSSGTEDLRLWALYSRHRDGWRLHQVVPAYQRAEAVMRIPPTSTGISHLAVTAVDRLGNESEPAAVRLR